MTPAANPSAPPPPPVVELVRAGFAYEDGPPVFDGIDFAVPDGRAMALLGRNGSGKTTLMRLLSGGLQVARGALRLAGEDVSYDRKGLTRLRTTVQLVVQDPDDQLFAASVGQDVSFGPLNLGLPEDEVRLRVREALEALDITARRTGRRTCSRTGSASGRRSPARWRCVRVC